MRSGPLNGLGVAKVEAIRKREEKYFRTILRKIKRYYLAQTYGQMVEGKRGEWVRLEDVYSLFFPAVKGRKK
jgi:hypothetical protein